MEPSGGPTHVHAWKVEERGREEEIKSFTGSRDPEVEGGAIHIYFMHS